TTGFSLLAAPMASVTDPINFDGMTLDIDLTTITEAGAGSDVVTTMVAKTSLVTVTVTATELRFVSTPVASQLINTGFTASVEYTDANGNRDLDRADTLNVTTTPARTFNSGAAVAASSGLVDLSGGNII